MELVFGYLAGLLTLINPCVLPVLPIVLATALQASRFGPLAVAAGMSVSFVTLGLLVTVLGYTIGLTEDMVARAGAILMVGFGLILMTPVLSERFATATAGVSSHADTTLDDVNRGGLSGQFLGGMLLGAVWSPVSAHVGRRDLAGVTRQVDPLGGRHHGDLRTGRVYDHHRSGLWCTFRDHAQTGSNAADCAEIPPDHGRDLCRRRHRHFIPLSPHARSLGRANPACMAE